MGATSTLTGVSPSFWKSTAFASVPVSVLAMTTRVLPAGTVAKGQPAWNCVTGTYEVETVSKGFRMLHAKSARGVDADPRAASWSSAGATDVGAGAQFPGVAGVYATWLPSVFALSVSVVTSCVG